MRLSTFQHPTEGFEIPVPHGWEQLPAGEDVALLVAEPARPPWFRANVVVTVELLDEDADLPGWADAATRALEDALDSLLVIDAEAVEVGGLPARRTLAHHDAKGHAVTLEQWAVVSDRLGFIISASVGTLDYDAYADLFAAVAEGFRPSA